MNAQGAQNLFSMAPQDRHQAAEQALAYMTECTLATIEKMVQSPACDSQELARQQGIAQQGIDAITGAGIKPVLPRVAAVVGSGCRVKSWAAGLGPVRQLVA